MVFKVMGSKGTLPGFAPGSTIYQFYDLDKFINLTKL